MNKIGIITLNGYYNYGNRLQNYALQEVIKLFGFDCETIINKTLINKSQPLTKFERVKLFLNRDIRDKYEAIYRKLNSKKIYDIEKERTKIFKEFTNQYINETEFYIEIGNIPENIEQKYKYFVAGSDQVWNPNDPKVSELSFLTFAPKYKMYVKNLI